MLKWRLIFGVLLILVLVGIFSLDYYFDGAEAGFVGVEALERSLQEGLLIALVCSALAMGCAYELIVMGRAAGYDPPAGITIIGAGVLPLLPLFGGVSGSMDMPLRVVILGIVLVCAFLQRMHHQRIAHTLRDVGFMVFSLVYIGLLLSLVVELRVVFGPEVVWLFVAVVKGSDIGAYFSGRLLGRRKLIPWLSPGKTVEGLVGAMIFSGVLAYGGVVLLAGSRFAHPAIFVVGMLMAVVSHFGDLIESMLKRECSAKDSAHVLPAFGGMLDLADSVLVAAPFWYIIMTYQMYTV